MRTRDRAAPLVAIRDHYLSAEIMGINLTKYRTLSFWASPPSSPAIAGARSTRILPASWFSQERFLVIERSILFLLAMIIIGGTGLDHGTLMGTALSWCWLPENDGIHQPLPEGRARSIIRRSSLNNNIHLPCARSRIRGVIIIGIF